MDDNDYNETTTRSDAASGSYSSPRQSRGPAGGRPMRPRRGRRKVCTFCADKVESINYKDVNRLRKMVSESGKILPKRMTGTCAKHQRELTISVKRARHLAFLPYTSE